MVSFLMRRLIIISTGVFADILIGDPKTLPHPVMGAGRICSLTESALRKGLRLSDRREEDRGKKLAAGVLLVCAVLLFSVAPPAALFWFSGKIHPVLPAVMEAVLAWQIPALHSLVRAAEDVRRPLEEGKTEEAREAVSMIVGRDTASLDEEGIVKAAVETVAENTSDGVIAPLFYMLLFGVLGGWVYKVINTMDSMTGYRNDRYLYLGRAAARLDDAANFIPARIAGIAMTAGAFLCGLFSGKYGGFRGYDGRNAWRILRRDARKHASPNAGYTEAACAGALHVALGGDAFYFGELHKKAVLGDPDRDVEVRDIRRAEILSAAASAAVFAAGAAALILAG